MFNAHVVVTHYTTVTKKRGHFTTKNRRVLSQPHPALGAHRNPTPVPRPPSPPLAPPSYDKAQTKKVLKHARAELMKEVGKAGYNVLVVEGCVFSLSWTRQSGTD